jgi:hypothetical protein
MRKLTAINDTKSAANSDNISMHRENNNYAAMELSDLNPNAKTKTYSGLRSKK